MVKNKNVEPPRWAMRFLNWYCKAELVEDLEGDLNEYFQRNLKERGERNARLIYVIDVLKFFRSYTLRKPKFITLLIQWIMIGSYIKTSGRSIVRNKLFSSINIIGLAISMSVGLLMIAFVTDLLSYDKFHEKGDRIYRVISSNKSYTGDSHDFASTSVKAGKRIKEGVTGVQEATILRKGFGGDAHVGDNIIPMSALWADEDFFNVFTFPIITGDKKTALKEPYSIVLTEKTARKLFDDENPLGKSVKFDTVDYVVTAVIKDVPTFSHMQFEALVSFTSAEITVPREKSNFLSWESMWQNYVYVVIPQGGDVNTLQRNLDRISTEENANIKNKTINLRLQALSNIALGPDLSNPMGPTMMISVVWVIAGLAFIVILSACFNYTNLSIARSLRRSREVGIRKVIGAQKGHVLSQFIAEAIIISLLALVFSFAIFLFLRAQFLGIAPELSGIVTLELSGKLVALFILFAVIVGIVAGFLPALFFSKINAVQVLKDASSMKVFRHVSMRRVLIVVQYTFSLIFITATIIGYKQYKTFLSFDLGFSTENVLNIHLQGNKPEDFIKSLSEMPEVSAISRSQMITNVGSYYGSSIKYNNPQDSIDVWHNSIDENYLPLHGHKFVAGRNFTAKSSAGEKAEIIVNEETLKQLEIGNKDPQKALGEVVTVDGAKYTIIGVLKDFQYGKAENRIEPVVFRYITPDINGFVNVKIASTDIKSTLDRIEHAWKKFDRVHPIEATFYDEQIEQAYSEFSAMLKIIGFLGFLAVCISSMGLFGMVVFTTETRLKEISIRKVLGASEGNLIYLLSRGFLLLLGISALVALPLTYLFFENVALASFANRAPIGLFDLFAGVLGVLIIAFLMIGSQTLKVTRTNPATVLKNE